MSGELASRFFLTTLGRDLELYPVDAERFRVFIDGEIVGVFTGYGAAHRTAVKAANEDNTFSEEQRRQIANLSDWTVETVDTFDPEEK
ncbi:hypothetical protein HYN69_05840 [Gemmobacter aquarius]|uniref:Uncharacterized protein n=1 Tax=Paragemmobacter aquarius TaxID=2169400 RepID=A0A2S0UJW6_9RHOB|nr:hypothetical protein [Gemmobacter aquarius]AWB48102.1 hypothetical protein HYN69_05840 [Gemmobacter aquarius]